MFIWIADKASGHGAHPIAYLPRVGAGFAQLRLNGYQFLAADLHGLLSRVAWIRHGSIPVCANLRFFCADYLFAHFTTTSY
jgi:hypothetical protein